MEGLDTPKPKSKPAIEKISKDKPVNKKVTSNRTVTSNTPLKTRSFVAERQKKFKAGKREAGYQQYTFWLKPEHLEKLDHLCNENSFSPNRRREDVLIELILKSFEGNGPSW